MKRVLLVLLMISIAAEVMACTTFLLEHKGRLVFGRNYDWVTGTGMVHSNLRGLAKRSLVVDNSNSFEWTSKYGSITFNQYGKEFPNGGMNEKGLVVEVMWLSETKYPAADKRPGLPVLQWVQYQLDNAATIDEVIASEKIIRIASIGAPLHFLVADARGQSATIEFLDGRISVHRSGELPYPVLTNSTYTESLKGVNKPHTNGFTDNSIDRFATACKMVDQFGPSKKTDMVDYSFGILDKVSQGSFTKWNIVYDITNRKLIFKTQAQQQLKMIDMAAMSFDCGSKPLSFNMNEKSNGNITAHFTSFQPPVNSRVLMQAFAESRAYVNIDSGLQNKMAAMPGTFTCHK
ncbi:linear amide C-N hydrolase [Segetibacter sp. 3557_3]|uniref:linear amide C-N hydrolase n=1 Tax=Segetibacter sp. 3557_3 TaxID=2547429 RepID=UPI0010588DC7|nr:linear amide C-N hydrolase [Segetibacter sp. 3557_3]TDH26116.1 linear amide C-N hydrolase [Segetibacter sp. 3557_3]